MDYFSTSSAPTLVALMLRASTPITYYELLYLLRTPFLTSEPSINRLIFFINIIFLRIAFVPEPIRRSDAGFSANHP